MLVKAIESFAGKISMVAGEVREIVDDAIVKDLLNAGYIEEVKAAKAETKQIEAKPIKKAKKK